MRAAHPARPTIEHERTLIDAGYPMVAGVDEVGRGALAGPVVAAAVVLALADDAQRGRTAARLADVRDSKALGAAARTHLAPIIEYEALTWALGEATAAEIDMLGITRGTYLAMRRALRALAVVPDAVVIDGRTVPSLGPWHQDSIVRGDGCVLSVSAASVIAKVRRDAWMIRLDEVCGGYGFAAHKGYGAASHRAAIAERGPTLHHRLTWRLLPIGAPVDVLVDAPTPPAWNVADEPGRQADAGAANAANARRPQANGRARRGVRGRAPDGGRLDDPGAQLALPLG